MSGDLNLSMFRAYDIRTPSSSLTPDLAARLARAEAKYIREVLGANAVVVAHDARSSGPRYLSIATEEFLSSGLDVVWVPGVSSTCMAYFAAMCHPEHAAIMFGASHNPAGDTGQKDDRNGLAYRLAIGLHFFVDLRVQEGCAQHAVRERCHDRPLIAPSPIAAFP